MVYAVAEIGLKDEPWTESIKISYHFDGSVGSVIINAASTESNELVIMRARRFLVSYYGILGSKVGMRWYRIIERKQCNPIWSEPNLT